MGRKERKEKAPEFMANVQKENKTAEEGPVQTWNKICRTYVEGDGGTQYLVEIQQNAATKEIKAVKV